jgi:DNA-binding response OmpR family regulator
MNRWSRTAKMPKIHMDEDRQECFVNGRLVPLTTAQFRILFALRKTRRVLSRSALLERVHDGDESFDKEFITIDLHISRLRKRLRCPHIIEAVIGVGFKYNGS